MREALAACEGVKKVEIDFPNRLATAIVDEKSATADKLVQAVKNKDDRFADTSVKESAK